MADPDRDRDTGDETGTVPDRGATTGSARWQKVVGIIGLVVLLGLGILMFGRGGGGHGPGRHDPDASPRIDVEVVAITTRLSHR